MSWLARSLVNSLKIEDEEEVVEEIDRDRGTRKQRNDDDFSNHKITRNNQPSVSKPDMLREDVEDWTTEDQSRGVKEDLTEFKQTLTRQFFGVAQFLAPPPPPPPPPPALKSVSLPLDLRRVQRSVDDSGGSELPDPSVSGDDEESSAQVRIAGTSGQQPHLVSEVSTEGISDVANDRVLENSGLGNSCHRSGSKGEEEQDWVCDAVGLSDEVLAFAGNIAHHPETWLDFPIEEEDDLDDFNMSECQKKHIMAIELLTPRLRALRIEFCPIHMSDDYFWKVYFVLLHSRLNKHDADLLSTPQVVRARAEWMKELQKQNKEEMERLHHKESAYLQYDDCPTPTSPQIWTSESLPPHWRYSFDPACSSTGDSEAEKHTVVSTDAEVCDKSVIEEEKLVNKEMVDVNDSVGPSPKAPPNNFYEDDDDDWPEDDFLEHGEKAISIPAGIEEDVSFSDLEDDDCSLHAKYHMG